MNKEKAYSLIKEYGVATVFYRNTKGKLKWIVADVEDEEYIRNKPDPKQDFPDKLLVWAYDLDRYRFLNPGDIDNIKPHSEEITKPL